MDDLDPSRPVRAGEELDPAALRRLLDRHAPHLAGPVEVEQFPRGHSNLTYRLRVGGTELVLRRPPKGAKQIKAGHDMGREYTVLTRLRPVWPKVPRTLFYVPEEESPFGVQLYVMERVAGLILRGTTLPVGLELDADGLLLGIEKDVTFADMKVKLETGDIVVFYTDGITETENATGEMFGWERLGQAVTAHRGENPEAMVSSILGAAVAPFIATWLATTYGVGWVGVYLLVAAVLTFVALLAVRETKDASLDEV